MQNKYFLSHIDLKLNDRNKLIQKQSFVFHWLLFFNDSLCINFQQQKKINRLNIKNI